MHSRRLFVLFGLILAFSFSIFSVGALASTPGFAITATNVTMASVMVCTTSGGVTSCPLGTDQFTVTGITAAGTVEISCQYSGPATEAKIPQYCGTVGVLGPVQAGETLNGDIVFVPFGQGPPPYLGELQNAPRPSGHLPASGLALAGALLFGFGLRRRARRWLVTTLFAVITLAGVAGISACAGGSNGMTPGTYQYTISAGFSQNNGPTIETTSTTINVTLL